MMFCWNLFGTREYYYMCVNISTLAKEVQYVHKIFNKLARSKYLRSMWTFTVEPNNL